MSAGQGIFRAAVLDPARPSPAGLSDGRGHAAGKRFDVYRNNVAVGLTEVLETGFPVIRKLIGEDRFSAVCGVFLRQSPPASPILSRYGDGFPAFLAGFEPLAHLRYLADVAALELAIRQSYHAADALPILPESLSAVPPERVDDLRLGLAPALRVVRSHWPIHDIWSYNTVENAPKPAPVAQDVLITRPEFDPAPQVLPPGGAGFIAALQQGATLGTAAEQAARDAPDFDLGEVLALLLAGNAIVSADLPGDGHA
ncbi:DUF2063 domain-containing protein [Roseovarius spongiae]|uniref:DUF2063 domain-containing protein n=1 Tax=Roseovarius spongiae TaxID=2320272 RepID=A0A3A8AYE4_9RHOB|nr:DNA-binding domain-containing protein [Roseovarius spongiae]RKF16449.1 DUF2063 domain-containing protein [Roseovarius spongiae]